MIPPWIAISLWVLGFVSLILVFVQALCAAAKNGDRHLEDEPQEAGRLIEAGHFGEYRSRRDRRNGLGGIGRPAA